MSAAELANLEGRHDFDVRWCWADGLPRPGVTAVLRIKDEAANLPWVLPPLFAAVDHVVFIDNRSTDGSADIARKVAADHDAEDCLEVHTYPFQVARCGPEHLATHPRSVHSLTYYYNWAFSHVRTRYALKWDGDMILTHAGVTALRDLAWQLEGLEAVIRIPRHGLYVASDQEAFLDTFRVNTEPWLHPLREGVRFVKAFEWELRMLPSIAEWRALPDGLAVETKYLNRDELANWSSTDFAGVPRVARKQRELDVLDGLLTGNPPPGVIAIRAPAGTHVIEYVTKTWLPQADPALLQGP